MKIYFFSGAPKPFGLLRGSTSRQGAGGGMKFRCRRRKKLVGRCFDSGFGNSFASGPQKSMFFAPPAPRSRAAPAPLVLFRSSGSPAVWLRKLRSHFASPCFVAGPATAVPALCRRAVYAVSPWRRGALPPRSDLRLARRRSPRGCLLSFPRRQESGSPVLPSYVIPVPACAGTGSGGNPGVPVCLPLPFQQSRKSTPDETSV